MQANPGKLQAFCVGIKANEGIQSFGIQDTTIKCEITQSRFWAAILTTSLNMTNMCLTSVKRFTTISWIKASWVFFFF